MRLDPKALLILLALSLAAHARAQQRPPAPDTTAPDELSVIDLRPPEEKGGTGLTPLAGKCNKDVFRIADVASDPLKVEALRADLARQLGLAGDGKTLMVLNWSVYYNKSVARSSPQVSNVGIMGVPIPRSEKKEAKRGSKCSQKESAGGWYEANEVTSSHPPIISEFSGTFGGKPFNVRIVHSSRRTIEGKFEGDTDDTQELLDTVHETAEALALAIVQ